MTVHTGFAKWRSTTAAEWEETNPVVKLRVLAVSTDTHRIKIGDGVTNWADLPYSDYAAAAEAVADLVDSAPGALDTLNELAAALGDDANFAATVTTALAAKAADSAVVHKTGAETVAGVKTFSSSPIVPTATTATQALNKGTADAAYLPLGPSPSGSDDTAILNAAMTAARASGARELHLSGDYLISSSPGMLIPDGLIVVCKPGFTRFRQAWWATGFDGFVTASGTYTNADVSGAVLTSDIFDGNSVLHLTSTANLVAGNYYLLGADRSFNDSSAAGVGSNSGGANDDLRYRGEIVRIATIDSGTQVTIYGSARDTYEVSHAASLKAISYNSGAGLVGAILENTQPDQHISSLAVFQYCTDFIIEDCKAIGADGPGFHIDMCKQGRIDVQVQDLTDNSGASRYGYGVLANRASEDLDIYVRAERGRHAFTTNGSDNHRGVPRNLRIRGTSNRSSNSAWDTHAQGADLDFDVTATNCATSAFNDRAARTKWKGTASYCNKGLVIGYPASGAQAKVHLSHMQGGTGCGVELGTTSQCDIEAHIDGCNGAGVRLTLGASRNVIRGTVKNVGNAGTPAPGVQVASGATGADNEIHMDFHTYSSAAQATRSTGAMTYPVDIQASGAGRLIVTDCRSYGATNALFVNDPYGNALFRRNRHMDKAEPAFMEDEMNGASTASGQIGSLGWGRTNGAGSNLNSEANHPGLFQLSTNAVASTITCINVGGTLPSEFFDCTYILRPNQADTDTRLRVGMSSNASGDAPGNGIYFEKLEADSNWFLVTRASSVQTRTATGIAVAAAAFVTLRIRRVDASTIGFTIGTNAEQRVTTNVPTAGMSAAMVQILSATTTSKTVDVDYFRLDNYALTR